MMLTPDRASFAFVGAFVDELARAGVRHVCISPGSRSTPLALMIAERSDLKSWVHLDERSGAFFALGIARASGEPVALLCTSGTAAANFYPAIVEANAAGVPLIVLTADRPPELRDAGAGQTIDQNQLYGSHVKWFVEVALPDASPAMLRYSRTLAARSAATARANPPGPVHLNFPFREPLVPIPVEPGSDVAGDDLLAWRGRPGGAPWVTVAAGSMNVDQNAVAQVASQLLAAKRPVIVCGPQADADLGDSVAEIATALSAPMLADPLSQMRWGAHDRSSLIDRYDAIVRHSRAVDTLRPDFILRIGAIPTSKALFQWIEKQTEASLVVVDAARWPDPSSRAHEMIQADARRLCEMLLPCLTGASRSKEWLNRWQSANDIAGSAIVEYSSKLAESFEGAVLAEIVACLPERATLFASSSMPVRDLDTFGEGDARIIRVMSNRGANGIDGVVSTALGAAAVANESGSGPLVLAIGDIAFYHDMNGLLTAGAHSIDATIVVINNDGGGIFSFLPQAANQRHFEKLFGTPHGLDFCHAARLYGAGYERADNTEMLRRAITKGIEGRGLHIVEVRTDRARNVVLHREALSAVARALDEHWS
jgi:2-succinyl-5-enolpyruvyl-6-hydroxy-3-cyclohexene-1-carboxylate synthase